MSVAFSSSVWSRVGERLRPLLCIGSHQLFCNQCILSLLLNVHKSATEEDADGVAELPQWYSDWLLCVALAQGWEISVYQVSVYRYYQSSGSVNSIWQWSLSVPGAIDAF